MQPTNDLRGALVVGGAGLLVRALFVAWAPGDVSGDAFWYHSLARNLIAGYGYVDPDGGPSVIWMPGWPLLLAGLYWVSGAGAGVGLAANVVLGGASCGLLTQLGARLFGVRVGRAAGAIYALWPGVVYYAATLMTETVFGFTLVLCVLLLVTCAAAASPGRQVALGFGAGLAFGAAALIKAEPLVLTPVLVGYLWLSLRDPRALARTAAPLLVATALMLAPWVVRNQLHFDRMLVTSASGGANVWIGNHRGATGGEDFAAGGRYSKQHAKGSIAETSLATNDAGWRDAWAFVRQHPAEEARIVANKLRLTYGADDGAVRLIRGVGVMGRNSIPAETARGLSRIANAAWLGVLALAALGATTLRRWPPATRLLLLGWIAAFLLVHIVFLGGPRFHIPQTPALALLAAAPFRGRA